MEQILFNDNLSSDQYILINQNIQLTASDILDIKEAKEENIIELINLNIVLNINLLLQRIIYFTDKQKMLLKEYQYLVIKLILISQLKISRNRRRYIS